MLATAPPALPSRAPGAQPRIRAEYKFRLVEHLFLNEERRGSQLLRLGSQPKQIQPKPFKGSRPGEGRRQTFFLAIFGNLFFLNFEAMAFSRPHFRGRPKPGHRTSLPPGLAPTTGKPP